jgi:hypothetical protein
MTGAKKLKEEKIETILQEQLRCTMKRGWSKKIEEGKTETKK